MKFDKNLLFIIVTLLLVGVAFCYSSSVFIAKHLKGDELYFIKNHLFALGGGFLVMIFSMTFDLNRLFQKKIIVTFLMFSLIGLIVVFIPGIGRRVSGANRWISLGFLKFQPSEFVKIFIVIYLPYILVVKADRLSGFQKGTLPPLIIVSFLSLLVALEPDLSTSLILLSLSFIIFYLGGTPIVHLLFFGSLSIPFLIYMFETKMHIFRRLIFFDPYQDPKGSGYHLIQSLISFVKGGLLGRGPGNSYQKIYRLPDAHTDFVFAVIGEEIGFVGTLTIVLLFFVLAVKGFQVSSRQKDQRFALLAAAITVLFTLQALIHIFVNIGLIPTTGVPLPFISYGRSALVVNMFLSGLLLNVSAIGRDKKRSVIIK